MDDLEGVLDDPHSQEFLSIVAAVHHQGVGEALHDGALGLAEPLGSVTAGRVGQVFGVVLLDGNVVLRGGSDG